MTKSMAICDQGRCGTVEVVKDRQEVGERILTYCMWDSSECE